MNVSEHIFLLLEKQDKKAKELADFLGIAQSSVSAWKNEGSYPSSKYIVRITEFFQVSFEFLFTGKNNSNHDSSMNLSKSEIELLDNYKKLDSRGQHKLQTIVYEELDRTKSDELMREAVSKGKQITFNLPPLGSGINSLKK